MRSNPERVSDHLSDAAWRTLFEHMLNGVIDAHLLNERGVAVDFVYLAVNPAFLRETGFGNVLGQRASDAIADLRASNPELLDRYARVAAGGPPERFEIFIGASDQWYEISVLSPCPAQFIAIFSGISARKRAEVLNESLHAQLQQAAFVQGLVVGARQASPQVRTTAMRDRAPTPHTITARLELANPPHCELSLLRKQQGDSIWR